MFFVHNDMYRYNNVVDVVKSELYKEIMTLDRYLIYKLIIYKLIIS